MRSLFGPVTGAALLLILGLLLWRDHNRVQMLEAELKIARTRSADVAAAGSAPSSPPARAESRLPLPAATASTQPPAKTQPATPRILTESERKFRAQANEMHRWDILGRKAGLHTDMTRQATGASRSWLETGLPKAIRLPGFDFAWKNEPWGKETVIIHDID